MIDNDTAAYTAGINAYGRGDERTSNPYYSNTPQWNAWNDGWDSQKPTLFNRIATAVVGWLSYGR